MVAVSTQPGFPPAVWLTNVQIMATVRPPRGGLHQVAHRGQSARVVLAEYPAGKRPGLRLRPYCCQLRQGSRMDEGLGTAVSGWTRVSSSARNRFGWVKAA